MDVTVVIPCFNESPENLRRAVASAAAPSAEVLVVDDGSTCGATLTALDTLAVQVIHTPNAGPARARNVGIAAGSAAFVLCLDSDDHLGVGLLEALAAHLRANPDTTIAFSEWQLFGAETDLVVPKSEIDSRQMLRQCPITNSSMFRRSDWRAHDTSRTRGVLTPSEPPVVPCCRRTRIMLRPSLRPSSMRTWPRRICGELSSPPSRTPQRLRLVTGQTGTDESRVCSTASSPSAGSGIGWSPSRR